MVAPKSHHTYKHYHDMNLDQKPVCINYIIATIIMPRKKQRATDDGIRKQKMYIEKF